MEGRVVSIQCLNADCQGLVVLVCVCRTATARVSQPVQTSLLVSLPDDSVPFGIGLKGLRPTSLATALQRHLAAATARNGATTTT